MFHGNLKTIINAKADQMPSAANDFIVIQIGMIN